jgi:hypothetical protein
LLLSKLKATARLKRNRLLDQQRNLALSTTRIPEQRAFSRADSNQKLKF